MKQRTKSILFHLPKVIIFGLALLNFFYIQSHISPAITSTTISFPAYTPWYETSDFSYVLMILAASVLLLISKRESYLAAILLSGFITAIGLFYIVRAIINFGLFELLQHFQKQENILLEWEVQIVLAGLVFSFTTFYLLQDFHRKRYS